MKILIAEIPAGGLAVTLDDQSWIPGQGFEGARNAQANLHFTRKDESRVFLSGSFSVELLASCDRCLDDYVYEVDSQFLVDFELLGKGEKDYQEKEHACSASEMDVFFLNEPYIDVFSILEQQLYLVVPSKRLCGKECRGLCTGCGVNLNTSPCDCVRDTSKSPFGVLARLKK